MRSVRTTFTVLEAVADNQPIGLSALARLLELPKSTVQRSLSVLAETGWIRADTSRDATRWKLGERVRTLGERVDNLGELRACALPSMTQLNISTLETVHLGALNGDHMRLIERMDSKHALRLVQPIGTQSPLHASSTGKAILAHLDDAEIDAYLEGDLERITDRTLVDPTKLRVDLREIKRRGYAIADQELVSGIISVAAHITSEGGQPIAALSVSGPQSRMESEVHTFGEQVVAAAAEVSNGLAARNSSRLLGATVQSATAS